MSLIKGTVKVLETFLTFQVSMVWGIYNYCKSVQTLGTLYAIYCRSPLDRTSNNISVEQQSFPLGHGWPLTYGIMMNFNKSFILSFPVLTPTTGI